MKLPAVSPARWCGYPALILCTGCANHHASYTVLCTVGKENNFEDGSSGTVEFL